MATEKRLIDAIALKRHMIKAMELANTPTINEDDLVYAIDHSDTVDAVEVAHGRWEQARFTEAPLYICSECDKPEYKQHRYCPNCGAKMDGGNDNVN